MRPRLRISRRSRLRLALLATFALLVQQFAFAAHACMLAVPEPGLVAAHCDGMSMPPAGGDALCGQHCAQPVSNATDARTPTVPPAMLPALLPPVPTLLPLARMSRPSSNHATPHPPPATIAFCTLQI